ncbi:hypothetical protein D3C75_1299400 [compost metagenome]
MGNKMAVINTNKTLENPKNDLINFLASAISLLPIHCPTTVTIATLNEFPPIWNSIDNELPIALTVIGNVPK